MYSCLMTIDKPTSGAQGGSSSPVEFRLDPASGVPTYLQLVQQVEHALRLGYLKPGDQLPKVRTSLAAKARALRTKSLADVEEAAQAASERMSLPVILLLCGFILFIGFPAIARVLEGI